MPIRKLVHEVGHDPPIGLGEDGLIRMDGTTIVFTLVPRILAAHLGAVGRGVMPVLDGLKRGHQDIDAVAVTPDSGRRADFSVHGLADGPVAGAEAEPILSSAKVVVLAKLLAGGRV